MAKVTMVIEDGVDKEGNAGLFVELKSDPEFDSQNLSVAQKLALSFASEIIDSADGSEMIEEHDERTIRPIDPSKH